MAGRRVVRGLPAPSFLNEEGMKRFKELDVFDDDVIVSSLPKGGTTWVAEILFQLFQGVNDDGTLAERSDEIEMAPSSMLYPEMLGSEPGVKGLPGKVYGEASWDRVMNKPRPRVISTHLYGSQFLPTQLVDPEGQGRLIIVLRNLKDVMVSFHHFFGEPKDGWLGNEHGVGTLARFLSTDVETCLPYGNYMEMIKANDKVSTALAPTGRVLVLYYEAMKEDLGREVDRIITFLGLRVPPAKRDAILEHSTFEGMKKVMVEPERGERIRNEIMRKGTIGDWRNHMDPDAWRRFDEVFDQILGDVAMAQPLKRYQADPDHDARRSEKPS